MDASTQLNMSSAILFLDVSNAFASMLRRSVFQESFDSDEAWLSFLSQQGFSPQDIQTIYDTIVFFASWKIDHEGNMLCDANDLTSPLMVNLTRAWYQNTWLSQDGIPNVIHTGVSSLAGTPLADIVFIISVSRTIMWISSNMFCISN